MLAGDCLYLLLTAAHWRSPYEANELVVMLCIFCCLAEDGRGALVSQVHGQRTDSQRTKFRQVYRLKNGEKSQPDHWNVRLPVGTKEQKFVHATSDRSVLDNALVFVLHLFQSHCSDYTRSSRGDSEGHWRSSLGLECRVTELQAIKPHEVFFKGK